MKLFIKKYKYLNEKEISFLREGYSKSFNELGFKENLFFRRFFAKFYIYYSKGKIIASASVLNNYLDHIYVLNKGSGIGTEIIKHIPFKYVQVIKSKYQTPSILNFYLINNFKKSFTFNKKYYLLKRSKPI